MADLHIPNPPPPPAGCRLLEAGNHAGLTALHYAAYLGRGEVIKVLFSYRADVCAQTDYFDVDWPVVNGGDTPLHIAAARGNEEVIRLLLRGYVSGWGGGQQQADIGRRAGLGEVSSQQGHVVQLSRDKAAGRQGGLLGVLATGSHVPC